MEHEEALKTAIEETVHQSGEGVICYVAQKCRGSMAHGGTEGAKGSSEDSNHVFLRVLGVGKVGAGVDCVSAGELRCKFNTRPQ